MVVIVGLNHVYYFNFWENIFMDKVSVSGIYRCSCGHEQTHVKGKNFAPCAKCGKNDEWTLVRETN